jgi:hypothetical protein
MGRKALQELGAVLEQAKAVKPTVPHPKAPDEPPANLVGGPAAAVTDEARSRVRSVVGRSKRWKTERLTNHEEHSAALSRRSHR